MKSDIIQKQFDGARKKFDWMKKCPICGEDIANADYAPNCSLQKWNHFEVNWNGRERKVILYSKALEFWNLVFSSFEEADHELQRILKLQAFK